MPKKIEIQLAAAGDEQSQQQQQQPAEPVPDTNSRPPKKPKVIPTEKEYLANVLKKAKIDEKIAEKKRLSEVEYLEQLRRQQEHAEAIARGSRVSSRLATKRLREGETGVHSAGYILSTLGNENKQISDNDWLNPTLQSWDDYHEAVVQFKSKNGRFPTTGPLNVWLEAQKKNMKYLQPDKKEMFEVLLGMRLPSTVNTMPTGNATAKSKNGKQAKPKQPEPTPLSWEEMYAKVKRFKIACGLFPMSGYLFDWIVKQKKGFKRLPADKKEKLAEIGISSDNTTEAESVPALYWESTEASKLFGFEHEEGKSIVNDLRERIDLLKKVNQTPDGWKMVVPDDEIVEKYTETDKQAIRHKVMYLIKVYSTALKEMPRKNLEDCCQLAVEELVELGLSSFNYRTVQQWNVEFRKHKHFAHPNKLLRDKQYKPQPDIFDHFPEAKDMFLDIANSNAHQLTGPFMVNEFRTTILPELEKQSREKGCFDDGSKGQKLLLKFIATPPSKLTVVRWMRKFNIEWDAYQTQRGRGGVGSVSRSMKEAWAAGKFKNRRPKGQGLKRGRESLEAEEQENAESEEEPEQNEFQDSKGLASDEQSDDESELEEGGK